MYATIPEYKPTIKVSGLHAIAYCPRLFYLEEVEGLYTQDAAVFAGRRLHVDLEQEEEEGEWEDLYLESEDLGIRGRVDALRTRHGETFPYEHKRGKANRDAQKQPQAWESDRLQIFAYCYLLELNLGVKIPEGRIRYHADNVLIHLPFDEAAKAEVREAIAAARKLQEAEFRPPVTENERLCARCSLAPVCLPEEARLAHNKEWQPIRKHLPYLGFRNITSMFISFKYPKIAIICLGDCKSFPKVLLRLNPRTRRVQTIDTVRR